MGEGNLDETLKRIVEVSAARVRRSWWRGSSAARFAGARTKWALAAARLRVYGRAVASRLSGEPLLYNPNGFADAARQALTKLGVKWEPTEAERAYNEGRTTQVPVNPVVRVKGRFSRQRRDL